jgi:nucleoside-diphosphate-sugar epimerase
VHTGTPYERGDLDQEIGPINPYAASKAAAFAVARMFQRTKGWPIVTVRPFQVYGPGQPEPALIPSAIAAVRAGEVFRMTGGEQRRDFIYVDDLVRGYLLAALMGVDGHSYDLGWGVSQSLKSVIHQLFRVMEAKQEPLFGVLPYRPGELWDLRADIGAATEELDWSPRVRLEQGLTRTAMDQLLDKPM